MITPDAAHGDDLTVPQRCDGGSQRGRVPCRSGPLVVPIKCGTTNGTGQRLCVEAAIQRIGIFGRTLWTKGKLLEGGIAPIVRQLADDGVARPALCAIDERVPVAA